MEIHFIDDNLVNYDGHNADYIESLCNELLIRGVNVHVSCNINLSIHEKNNIRYHKVFDIQSSKLHSYKLKTFNFKIIRIIWSNLIFFKNYFRIKFVINKCSLSVLNDLSPRNYFGFLFFTLITSLLGTKSRFLIIFHDRIPKFQYYLLMILRCLSFGHKFFYASQSKIISEDLKSRFNLNVINLPTPQIFENFDKLEYTANNKLNISFVGLASKAKGFEFLISYLKHIILSRESSIINHFQFTIQISNITNELLNESIKEDIDFISNQKSLVVDFVIKKLSNSDYINVFAKSNFIIAPYNPLNYRFIQSGVVTQSISCGKPVILTNNTYCSFEAKELGVGVIFEYNNFSDLTEKLIYAKVNYDLLTDVSISKADTYRQEHGPKKYVDILINEFVK